MNPEPEMNDTPRPDPALGLAADVFAEPPPVETKARVLAAIASRPRARVEALGPVDVLSTIIDGVGDVLDSLGPDEWSTPGVLAELDVKQVVAHLHGADQYLGVSVGAWEGSLPADENDHRAASQATIDDASDKTMVEVRDAWEESSARLLDHLRQLPEERLGEPGRYHILEAPLGSVLIARAFEVWTHGDDICRATGRELVPPPAAALAAMTQAGTGLVPLGFQLRNGSAAKTVKVVLTGDGGGTWTFPLGPGAPSAPDVTVVADAVSFCRLVANRVTFDDLDCEIEGDHQLAELALAGVSMLALD